MPARGPVRTLDRLDVERVGDEIRIHAAARSFLHHQVRSMTGTLAKAGSAAGARRTSRRRSRPRDRRDAGRWRRRAGYLVGVSYRPADEAKKLSSTLR